MQKTVNIRSRKNSDIKKTITARAWEYYPKDKWELDNLVQASQEVKKKPVDVVVTNLSKSVPIDDFVPPIVDKVIQNDDLGDSNEFVNPVHSEIDSLREQYEAKFGKPADKRMKEETLKQKLNESI